MINNLIEYFKNKKILILGFGREGQSTYKLIRKYLQDQPLFIADQKENFWENNDLLRNDQNVTFISGSHYLEDLENYDIIMKSPGISFAGLDISSFKDKINSELELLLEFYPNLTIGITGTKGKSTTSSLIYKILQDQNKKVVLLGNIGIPVFDYIDTLTEDTILVLEMSSHQLEFMKKSPHISLLLNIFPEHLDHYNNYDEYIEAKLNISKYQREEDYFLYNLDNPVLKERVTNLKEHTLKVSLNNEESDLYLKEDNIYYHNEIIYNGKEPRNLLGDYNLNNIMFALGVAEILHLDRAKTKESISTFKPLAHRLELVGKFNDIYFYDNSIATIPEATIAAIEALKEVDTLIIGGMDRGIQYEEFIQYLNQSKVEHIICMPKTGHDIAHKLVSNKAIVVDSLEEAVKKAKEVTAKDKICLLSPAAASYGFFKNFEEKGDLFKKLVKEN